MHWHPLLLLSSFFGLFAFSGCFREYSDYDIYNVKQFQSSPKSAQPSMLCRYKPTGETHERQFDWYAQDCKGCEPLQLVHLNTSVQNHTRDMCSNSAFILFS